MTRQGLAGRVAIVTGGAHGIGRHYCLRFAQEGASVVVADLDGEGARSVAKEITNGGGTALAVDVDVSDASSLDRMMSEVCSQFGDVDILVNNAAVFSVVPMSRVGFDSIEPEEWEHMLRVNVTGVWLACRAVVPHMNRRGRGRIINISSTNALKGARAQIHYVTSKAAIIGFTKNLARELGAYGITVNVIAPGSTLSEEDPDVDTLRIRSAGNSERSIQRTEVPADLVGLAAFLASDDAAFISGQTIVVDGGLYLH
jgi:3-oxoacyl-[acyl-carrier protein] reductase